MTTPAGSKEGLKACRFGAEAIHVASIRASCPWCGDVKLRPRDLTLRVCADTDHGTYSFVCPRCGDRVARGASPRICALLVSAGVQTEVWRRPAELLEPRLGPPLTVDDLLDFHLLLAEEGWFDRFVETVRDPSG